MKITVKKGLAVDAQSQALILALAQDEALSGTARAVDVKTGGLVSEVLKNRDFEGKCSQIALLYTKALPSKRIALVGLGKKKDLKLETIRKAYAKAAQYLRDRNISEMATALDFSLYADPAEKVAAAAAEGAFLGLYQYTPYKTIGRDEIKTVRQLDFLVDASEFSAIREEVQKTLIIAEAVCFARDLVSAPSNEMTPSIMAGQAKAIAKRKNVSCTIFERDKMQKLGMNALLGVASGSHQPPKFIILEYSGGKKGQAPLVLVGKGLTFDSGGVSLKPAEKMDEMKTDMSGGAAAMACIMAAADLKLPVNLVGLIPATENMPGGSALKPGDILKSYSGQTIEVLNTDAEGRLILADALSYASHFKPCAIIDIATLTGACIVALGDDVIGLLGTDDALKNDMKKASEATGELLWELPLWDIYAEQIKSDIADFKNTGGRPAGTITAATFLSKFAGDYPWAHLDIAGPAWSGKDKAYIPKGASGTPVRLLMDFLRSRYEK